jgi:riboflavin kinase
MSGNMQNNYKMYSPATSGFSTTYLYRDADSVSMSYTVATLKALALRGGNSDFITVSTSELGAELGVSQQTASNRLVALERSGLVKRRRGVHGQDVMLTREGITLLRKEYSDYRQIFGTSGPLTITGTVEGGLGEGQYYLNKPGYRDQIKEKLGFVPFNGTLNVRVSEAEMSKLSMVPSGDRVQIESFKADGRTYGAAECIPVTVGSFPGAIILPNRSHHTGVLEIISPKHLRTEIGLKDGNVLEITVAKSL